MILVILVVIIGIVAGVWLWQYRGAPEEESLPSEDGASIESETSSRAEIMAKTSRVIAAMTQIRTAALMIYSMEMSYQDLNCNHSEISALCAEIQEQAGEMPVFRVTTDSYCAYVLLPNGSYYYIDSEGLGEQMDVSPEESGLCI